MLVEGKASDPKPVLSGVPQGTVLGPLLFNVYINDISKGLSKGTKLKLFADDSLLYRIIRTVQDSLILQKDLLTLQEWEIKWKMQFHPGKCQLIRITNKINPIENNYTIHGVIVEKTESAKYLGVVINSSLKWKDHYQEINKKVNSILGLLQRNFSRCSTDIKSKCYTTLVRPRLEYGGAVWDPHTKSDIEFLEKMQKRGARFATNNYKMETGNTKLNLDKLGWDTLEERRLKAKVSLFHKARLKLIDIPTAHLNFKRRTTRLGGEGEGYERDFSPVDAHRFSFYPSTTNLWNHLPTDAKCCEDINLFTTELQKINLTALKSRISVN